MAGVDPWEEVEQQILEALDLSNIDVAEMVAQFVEDGGDPWAIWETEEAVLGETLDD